MAAAEIAVKQGVGVILAGSVGPQGRGYAVAIKASEAVTGNVLTSVEHRASGKDQVLAAAARAAVDVREALGDDTSDSARRFATETLSATSLDVVRDYAAAMQALSNADFDGARRSFDKALQRDPDFGLAHATMAITLWNRREQQEAEKYAKEAMRHLDQMTERERYRARGIFYMVTGDHQTCVKEFSDLITRYSADVGAHNNLALCATKLRNLPYALDMMRRVVQILPNRALYRVNLALYASYAGDFATGGREASTALDLGSPLGLQPLAFAYLGQGELTQAAATYRKFASPLTASDTVSGLGDLAVYEGRFSDAVRLLERGAAADAVANNRERAAGKLAGVAYAHLLRGQRASAIAAAEKALANSSAVKTRFLAARAFVEAGAAERAESLGAGLAADLQPEPQAYGKIVQGEAALRDGDARRAIILLNEANRLLDTWIGRFALGRAYLEAGMLVQADSEFDQCIKRRGEAVSLFLDEEPTYSVFRLSIITRAGFERR